MAETDRAALLREAHEYAVGAIPEVTFGRTTDNGATTIYARFPVSPTSEETATAMESVQDVDLAQPGGNPICRAIDKLEDILKIEPRRRYREWLDNKEAIAQARKGLLFRPLKL